MEVSLVVLGGKQKGRVIVLPPTFFLIGRDPRCHLRPHSGLVSRRHCAIARRGPKILVRDLKSVNGTFLNRERIKREVEVHDGDVLEVGDISFSFTIKSDELAAKAAPAKADEAFGWLLDSAKDSDVLDLGFSTVQGDSLPRNGQQGNEANGSADGDANKAKDTGSKDLSAGEYLQDYCRKPSKPG